MAKCTCGFDAFPKCVEASVRPDDIFHSAITEGLETSFLEMVEGETCDFVVVGFNPRSFRQEMGWSDVDDGTFEVAERFGNEWVFAANQDSVPTPFGKSRGEWALTINFEVRDEPGAVPD